MYIDMIKNPNTSNWEYSLVQDLVWLIARSSWLVKYAISNICENYHNGYHYFYDYLVHHLVLSFIHVMFVLFLNTCHFVCFLFLLNAWAFVVEFVLAFMSWGKDCADVQVYRTITLFLFLFLFFHLFHKKEKESFTWLLFLLMLVLYFLSFCS